MKVLRNQRGFTLIELIIVIVVLGVLSAVAIPQYINLQQDAQAASNVGYIGGLRSAMAIAAAGNILSKPGTCMSVMTPGTPPTLATVQGCVTGSAPTSLTAVGQTLQGIAPAGTGGSLGTQVTWSIGYGNTGTVPYTLNCSNTTNYQC